jgi:predicted PurR-regulated permease PerM
MQEMRSRTGGQQQVIETALALLLVSALLAATFWVLLPFVGVVTYAVILATATAAPYDRMVVLLGGRRRLAAFSFGAIAAAITVVPLIYLCTAVVSHVDVADAWLRQASARSVPDLPGWISSLPLLGQKVTLIWQEFQGGGLALLQRFEPQLAAAGRWLLNLSAGLMIAILEIFAGIIVAAMIHASRTRVVGFVSAIAERIVGARGLVLLNAGGKAIRGVAIGVIGTALLEGVLSWIGFAVAGVPGAIVLAAVTFFLAIIQIGPRLVWLPVAIWLGSQGQTGWTIFIVVWGIFVLMAADNVVKPMLIARSGELPLLVLFVGVIGGLAAWGFTGMFIGATTLAVLWTVLQTWIRTNGDELHPVG